MFTVAERSKYMAAVASATMEKKNYEGLCPLHLRPVARSLRAIVDVASKHARATDIKKANI